MKTNYLFIIYVPCQHETERTFIVMYVISGGLNRPPCLPVEIPRVVSFDKAWFLPTDMQTRHS